ncbi:hypothetical protein [Christensenella timonensis]|uniref:hypothetical protein n=1 Tax=Christensenella timonensis TaxID=1816678 RepID=UPI00082D98E5|nr:hypothetical protein [Christensenella timonensis]
MDIDGDGAVYNYNFLFSIVAFPDATIIDLYMKYAQELWSSNIEYKNLGQQNNSDGSVLTYYSITPKNIESSVSTEEYTSFLKEVPNILSTFQFSNEGITSSTEGSNGGESVMSTAYIFTALNIIGSNV